MLKPVLFAILKKVLIIFIVNIDREYKQCNIRSVLKRYHNSEDVIFQEPLDEYARFKDLDKTLKALEENLSVNNYLT